MGEDLVVGDFAGRVIKVGWVVIVVRCWVEVGLFGWYFV
jgi:hypothetical protein